jgi:hypothetical protein
MIGCGLKGPTMKTIDYSAIPQDQKQNLALLHLEEWLGVERYAELVKRVRKVKYTEDNRLFLEDTLRYIAGVEGYPVTALMDMHLGEDYDPKQEST